LNISYSSFFPHWLINSFFGFFSLVVLVVTLIGLWRFWQAMKTSVPPERLANPAKGFGASILSTLRDLWLHDRFTRCGTTRSRYLSHMLVFFGFLALCVVTLWVITGKHNPLISHEFVYPFPFWSPWKGLANLAGLAIMTGCLLMIRDRLKQTREAVAKWIERARLKQEDYLFPSRLRQSPHLSTRQYARVVDRWVQEIGLDPAAYGTHSLRRTKASLIYRRTKNLRAVQLLLGHTKLESTVRYLGIEVDDALEMAEQTEV